MRGTRSVISPQSRKRTRSPEISGLLPNEVFDERKDDEHWGTDEPRYAWATPDRAGHEIEALEDLAGEKEGHNHKQGDVKWYFGCIPLASRLDRNYS